MELDSNSESEPCSPAAKRPRLSDHRASDAEQLQSVAADATDAEDVADQTVAADENDEQISQGLSASCSCSDANHFSALETARVRAILRQIKAAPAKETESFLIRVLTAGMFADTTPHGSNGPQRRVKF